MCSLFIVSNICLLTYFKMYRYGGIYSDGIYRATLAALFTDRHDRYLWRAVDSVASKQVASVFMLLI